jgi:hypothetical protein
MTQACFIIPYVKQYNAAVDKLAACTAKLNHTKLQLKAKHFIKSLDQRSHLHLLHQPTVLLRKTKNLLQAMVALALGGLHVFKSSSSIIVDALLRKEKAVN